MRTAGWEMKMVDRDLDRALLSAYRNSVVRYRKLLETHKTEIERDYIKERLVACAAAIKALSGPGSKAEPRHPAENCRPRATPSYPTVLGWGTWPIDSKVQAISQRGSATGLCRRSKMGPLP